MNTYIESFHSRLERDCYSMNEFNSYIQVYEVVSEYMNYYNNKYCHGSLNGSSALEFYVSSKNNEFEPKAFIG